MEGHSRIIREATQDDDIEIAQHLHNIMLELGFSEKSMQSGWLEKTLEFLKRARHEIHYQGFMAEINGQVIGSVSCQILELYPMLSLDYQKGYIWGLYIALPYRRQGIATQLMQAAANYLKSIGCTKAVLHASETGKLLYSHLGYADSNEMVLNLTQRN
ncbi:MAG: GNAT family N-acetyltransferase [Cyanobacteria bacterium P01_H01_bin.26]